jgi:oligogalacturonide lyase
MLREPVRVTTKVPTEWLEPTGYRVVRLTSDAGGLSLYFHQNGYTAKGDKLVISTKEAWPPIDLKSKKIERDVEAEKKAK